MSDSNYTPPGGPPQAAAPSLFLQLGMARLYDFCAKHYVRLSQSTIAGLFPIDPVDVLEASRKQAEFIAGVLGGPKLYALKHGSPRMRNRHQNFTIDESARREWMRCFRDTLGSGSAWGLTPEQAEQWLDWTEAFSQWMVNREG